MFSRNIDHFIFDIEEGLGHETSEKGLKQVQKFFSNLMENGDDFKPEGKCIVQEEENEKETQKAYQN